MRLPGVWLGGPGGGLSQPPAGPLDGPLALHAAASQDR